MTAILITGASGLLGKKLSNNLLDKGFKVHTLGRSPKKSNAKNLLHFGWDVEKGKIESKALEGVSAIIHLAGAGVADKAWTSARKKEIIDSRVVSANLLFSHLQKNKHTIKTFISASAVGIYGDQADKELKETAPKGEGFLADVCEKWEQAAIQFSSLGIREVRARIGIVLSKDGGALPELTQSLPFGIAPYFAKKNLYYPWIHIDDVVGIFSYLLQEEKCEGAYNTTAPNPVEIKTLMQAIVQAKQSGALVVPAPPLAIKLAMGERSEMILSSQRCSADKIRKAGYQFLYTDAQRALEAIYAN